MSGGLRISVYRITTDGERRDLVPEEHVEGADYTPRYPSWPDCTCPRCAPKTPGPEVG